MKTSWNISSRAATASTGARVLAALGALVLGLGAALHVVWGYPSLARAIELGHISNAPGMSPAELRAVWTASGLLMVVMALPPLLALPGRTVFRRVALVSGIGLLGCGALIASFVGYSHPAVIIFGVSGILFAVAGALA